MLPYILILKNGFGIIFFLLAALVKVDQAELKLNILPTEAPGLQLHIRMVQNHVLLHLDDVFVGVRAAQGAHVFYNAVVNAF